MFDKSVIGASRGYFLSKCEEIKSIINDLRIGFYDPDSKPEYDKKVKAVFDLPNFDPEIFKEITNLDLTKEWKLQKSKKE